MKAMLYAVKREADWEARLSIAWETDVRYWTGCELAWLKQQLPLGMAEMACERLNARWQRSGGKEQHPAQALPAAASWAAEQAGEPEVADRAIDCGVGMREVEKVTKGSGSPSLGSGGDNACVKPFGGGEDWPDLAREAADRLRGSGLLLTEALAALGIDDTAALLPALQFAALRGSVRFTAAVAPEARSGAFLRWRRGGSTAPMRCRRCGSREAQLRRTPCAACGRRRCAYCEACLTMGRSRECGLLILGAPALVAPVRKEPQGTAGTVPVRVDERWGLSPAQQEAAETALAFLLRRERQPAPVSRRFGPQPEAAASPVGVGPYGQARQTSASAPLEFKLSRFSLGSWTHWRRRMTGFLSKTASEAEERVFLLWAVTGAGKTEMMFPLLEAVLSAGGTAAVATPRRDVVLELAPRLAAAFPRARQVVLYGGSEDRFRSGDLTLATTHQLIRFKEAFDLVVIDEVDAFPFHNDPALHYAAAAARARGGMTLLLSATPPPAMQRKARRGRLPHARVAVRHHRRPLPVPGRLTIPPLSRWALAEPAGPGSGRLPPRLREAIRASLARGAQVFLFVPYIRQVEPLVRLLRRHATDFGIAPSAADGTSSQDPERGAKVTRFRERSIRLLVTTTILERGVTIPKSDVFVLDADKPLFDAAALVQMAGRAGRSVDDPHGRVYLAASAWTSAQRDACRQIREMNAHARRKGYLIHA